MTITTHGASARSRCSRPSPSAPAQRRRVHGADTAPTAAPAAPTTAASARSDPRRAAGHRHHHRLGLIDGRADLDGHRRDLQGHQPRLQLHGHGPGTGDGFKTFCKGGTDISDASRKIKDEEAATCKAAGIEYIELKIAYRWHHRHDVDGQHRGRPACRSPTCTRSSARSRRASRSGRRASPGQGTRLEHGLPGCRPDIIGPGEESGHIRQLHRAGPRSRSPSQADGQGTPPAPTTSRAPTTTRSSMASPIRRPRSAGSASPTPRRTRTRSRRSASPRTPTAPA